MFVGYLRASNIATTTSDIRGEAKADCGDEGCVCSLGRGACVIYCRLSECCAASPKTDKFVFYRSGNMIQNLRARA